MLRTIHFYGNLADKYGSTFKLAVQTPAEAIRALTTQLRGLEADIRRGEWICVRGDYETGLECDEDLLHLNLGSLKDFHLIPAAYGRKSGIGKIFVGFALIAATVITGGAIIAAMPAMAGLGIGGAIGTFGIGGAIGALGTVGWAIAGVGALFVLGGASMLLAPHPKLSDTKGVDQRQGYLFQGAANTAIQGGACPIVLGRIRAGSVIVSAGVSTERIGAAGIDYSSTGGNISYTNMLVSQLL